MRMRREYLGVSQGRLGRHLGLTFSQVQKYEKGTNRIGAGRLYQISDFLGVPPAYFFEGIREGGGEATTPSNGGLSRDELRALNEAFAAIGDPETRKSVMALVRSLAADSAQRDPRR